METVLLLAGIVGVIYVMFRWTDVLLFACVVSFFVGIVVPVTAVSSVMIFGGAYLGFACFMIGVFRGAFNIIDGITQPRQQHHYHDNRHINVFTEDGRNYRVDPRQLER